MSQLVRLEGKHTLQNAHCAVVKLEKRDRGESSNGKGKEEWTFGMRQDNIKHGSDYTSFADYQADVDADAEGDVESDYS